MTTTPHPLPWGLRPLMGALLFVGVAVLVFWRPEPIIGVIIAPFCALLAEHDVDQCQLQFMFPQEALQLYATTAVVAGAIAVSPAFIALVSRFVAPTLRRLRPGAVVVYALLGLGLTLASAVYVIWVLEPLIYADLVAAMVNSFDADFVRLALNPVLYASSALYRIAGYGLPLLLILLGVMAGHSALLARQVAK